LADEELEAPNEHGDPEHAHSAMRYYLAFGWLFICTVLTYGLHHVDLGAGALPIAMVIAFAKAMVVILFFMHLWDHPGVNRLVLGVTILFLGVRDQYGLRRHVHALPALGAALPA
jgi:cytochrome c oxidase subunit 4